MFKLSLKLAIYGMWESFKCELVKVMNAINNV